MPDRLLIGQGEACQRLGVSRLTLIAEIAAGRLRYVLVGKRRKFKPAELEAYIERQERGCAGDGPTWLRSVKGRQTGIATSRSKAVDFETALARTTKTPPKFSPRKSGQTPYSES